jgi:hypothetical protein
MPAVVLVGAGALMGAAQRGCASGPAPFPFVNGHERYEGPRRTQNDLGGFWVESVASERF